MKRQVPKFTFWHMLLIGFLMAAITWWWFDQRIHRIDTEIDNLIKYDMNTHPYHAASLAKKTLKVIFTYKGGYHSFQPEQIIRLQSESNYTYISDKKPILMDDQSVVEISRRKRKGVLKIFSSSPHAA